MDADFDSLAAVPLGIWLPPNNASFEEQTEPFVAEPIEHSPLCCETSTDLNSPTDTKTYAELHVFPTTDFSSGAISPPESAQLTSLIKSEDHGEVFTVLPGEGRKTG